MIVQDENSNTAFKSTYRQTLRATSKEMWKGFLVAIRSFELTCVTGYLEMLFPVEPLILVFKATGFLVLLKKLDEIEDIEYIFDVAVFAIAQVVWLLFILIFISTIGAHKTRIGAF